MLVTLLAIPNRFVYQVAVSAAIVGMDTAASVHSLTRSPQSSLTTLLSIYAASAVAFVAAWQLHLHRRREFLHREREDAARAAAESDLAERRRTEERLRATLESIADGFLACDEEWRFVYVNAPAERILGIGRAELLGQSLLGRVPAHARHQTWSASTARAAAGEVRDFENFYEPWGRWFHNRCFPREGGGISVYFEDITERKRAESRTALHSAVTSILAESDSLAEAAPRLLEQMGRQVGAVAGEVWLVDAAHRAPASACAWQLPGAGRTRRWRRARALEYARGEGVLGRVWADGRAASGSPTSAPSPSSGRESLWLVRGFGACLAFPIGRGDGRPRSRGVRRRPHRGPGPRPAAGDWGHRKPDAASSWSATRPCRRSLRAARTSTAPRRSARSAGGGWTRSATC